MYVPLCRRVTAPFHDTERRAATVVYSRRNSARDEVVESTDFLFAFCPRRRRKSDDTTADASVSPEGHGAAQFGQYGRRWGGAARDDDDLQRPLFSARHQRRQNASIAAGRKPAGDDATPSGDRCHLQHPAPRSRSARALSDDNRRVPSYGESASAAQQSISVSSRPAPRLDARPWTAVSPDVVQTLSNRRTRDAPCKTTSYTLFDQRTGCDVS